MVTVYSTLVVIFKVSLYFSESTEPQNVCGGSIYSETVVVTAAHCCKIFEEQIDESYFEVIAGELNLCEDSGLEQRSKIKNYLIHPEYTSTPTATNDICLLYLEDGFDLSGDNVKSIPLGDKDPEVGTDCYISGWGLLQVGKNLNY